MLKGSEDKTCTAELEQQVHDLAVVLDVLQLDEQNLIEELLQETTTSAKIALRRSG